MHIPGVFSRALHRALYEVEQALNGDHILGLDSMAIGVIFMTSRIFRNFVLKTLEDEDSHGDILILDPNSNSLTIIASGSFSAMKFILAFDEVFHATAPAVVSFTREKVLFACSKSLCA